MESNIVITIPNQWLGNRAVSQDELRQALRLGLELLRRQTPPQENATRVIQVLLRTGKVQHLAASDVETEASGPRQIPPTLTGAPVSEILVAQRRGEL